MSDDKGKGATETIADEVKGVAVEVYKDVGRPVLAPVGKLAGGFFNLVLWPVKLALDTANTQLGKLSARGEQRLKAVPPERQIAAPATVAGPVALQYALLGDDDDVSELRDLFETLLMRAMDIETTADVHPGFVAMISQLTSDEARILRSIDRRRYAAFNLFDTNSDGYVLTQSGLVVRTLLGDGIGIEESRMQQYLSNLERVGILRIDFSDSLAPDSEREELERRVDAKFAGRSLSIYGGTAVPRHLCACENMIVGACETWCRAVVLTISKRVANVAVSARSTHIRGSASFRPIAPAECRKFICDGLREVNRHTRAR